MRDPRERLKDILEAIDNIQRYVVFGKESFERDELIQNWFVRHLQIIGEAARALPDNIKGRAPGLPWPKIVGMRHILVHDYFAIDTEVVWEAVATDLPALAKEIKALLEGLERGCDRRPSWGKRHRPWDIAT